MTALDTLLGKLDHVRKSGAGYVARCPAHEDKAPSLSVRAGDDGRALLYCHAGCDYEAIVAAVGLQPSDLFERDPRVVYRIKSLAGKVVALHERTEAPYGKHIAWRRPDGASGLNGTATADLPLFAAHGLPPAPGPAVVVTEGEKAAAALISVGVVAVGTVTGAAGTPSAASLEALRGRHVVLWPDADDVGIGHMTRIGAALAGVAASVRWATWLDAPAHGDAADLVRARRDPLDVIDAASSFVVGPVAPTIGTMTGLDLDHSPPPPQLAEPFIAPRGVTVLYGKGGVGKGITAAYLIRRLVRDGHVVMILDYEGHPEEWGSRLRGLGLADDELRHVHYREPYGPEWTAQKGPLRDVAHLVRDDAATLGVTVLLVDSYTTATSTGDTMGGQAAAQEFFAGTAMVGLPVLVLAHVRGEAQRFPERPFGSVFVHNLARVTWAVESLDPDDHDPENPFAPQLVRLELRNMKRNRGGKHPPVLLTFAFNADGSILVTDETAGRRRLGDVIAGILDGPMTVPQIITAIHEDTDEKHPRAAIRSALLRDPRRFVVDTAKRPHRWSLRP